MFVATVNVPGYLPMAEESPVFASAWAAWDYLADERTRGEDDMADEDDADAPYSDTRETLAVLGTEAHWRRDGDTYSAEDAEWLANFGLNADGTGTVYGDTPGYEGRHDLGLAYSVSWTDDDGEGE